MEGIYFSWRWFDIYTSAFSSWKGNFIISLKISVTYTEQINRYANFYQHMCERLTIAIYKLKNMMAKIKAEKYENLNLINL